MTWFKVDDRLHAHPKALAASLAALGLWTVAGSWSSDHLTDGFMPDHVVPLLCRGSNELAEELVAAGLWRRVRGGYRFHQWTENGDGSRRNPTRKEVENLRQQRADAGRKGGLSSGNARSKPEANGKQVLKQKRSTRGSTPDPSRPITTGGVTTYSPRPDVPCPPRTCQKHRNTDDPPPCGACADARRNHDTWQREHRPPPVTVTPLDGQQAAARARAERNLRVIAGGTCQVCNDTGWTTDQDANAVPCHHQETP